MWRSDTAPSPRLRGEGRGEGASPQALSGKFALAETPPLPASGERERRVAGPHAITLPPKDSMRGRQGGAGLQSTPRSSAITLPSFGKAPAATSITSPRSLVTV